MLKKLWQSLVLGLGLIRFGSCVLGAVILALEHWQKGLISLGK